MTDVEQKVVDLVPGVSADEQFENLWSGHPKRDGSKGSKRISNQKYKNWLRSGATYEDFVAAQNAYRKMCERQALIGTEFVLQAQTWFTSRWDDEIEEPDDPLDGFKERLMAR